MAIEILEILMAHMIIVEREEQTWIADLVNDDERFADRCHQSEQRSRAGAEALVSVTGGAAALLAALKAAVAETEALAAGGLPAEFLAHRGSYWRPAHNLLQGEHHRRQEHLYQIEQNLRAPSHCQQRAGHMPALQPEATAGRNRRSGFADLALPLGYVATTSAILV